MASLDPNEDNPYRAPQIRNPVATTSRPNFFDWINAIGLGLMTFCAAFGALCSIVLFIMMQTGSITMKLTSDLWIYVSVCFGLAIVQGAWIGRRYIKSVKAGEARRNASKLRRQKLLDLENDKRAQLRGSTSTALETLK